MAPAFSPLLASNRIQLALVPALMLGLLMLGPVACGEEGPVPRKSSPVSLVEVPSSTASAPSAANEPLPPVGYTDGSGINEYYPDLSPRPLAPDLEGTEAGARNVLLAFTRAIELREFDQAWEMLDQSAQQRWSKAEFNRFFAGLRDIAVAVPDGTIEGAAGSSYYTSNADLTATSASGNMIEMEGKLVLRRVNDVAGATERQLLWQVYRVDLPLMS